MKISSVIRGILGWLALPLYFLILVGLDVAFRLLYQIGEPSWNSWLPLLFTLGWAGIFTVIASFLGRTGGRIFIISTVCLFGLLTIVHGVMYNLFGNFLSFSDFTYAGEGAKFFSLQYIKVRKALLFVVGLSILGSVVVAWILPSRGIIGHLTRLLPRLILLVVSIVLLVGLHTYLYQPSNHTMTWDVAIDVTDADRQKGLYSEFSKPNGCMHLTGLYHYTYRNAAMTINDRASRQDTAALRDSLTQWHETRQGPVLSEYAGSLEGKNLIMVMLESVDSVFVTSEYMPNLYALQQKSISFENHYTPLYITAGTFGTEFLSQTGLIPPQKSAPTSVYTENAFPYTLPHLFRQAGYTANSFHAASGAIYNRAAIHKHLGFEEYSSYSTLGMEDYQRDSQLLNGFQLMVSQDPFYSFILTYSGHGPYNDTMSNIANPHLEQAAAAVEAAGVTGSQENMEEFTRAVAHAMETDAFVGGLVEKLEESGHSEDTVLVFFADHYCKYLTDPAFLMEMKGVSNRNMLAKTPWFIHIPGEAPMEIQEVTSSVDIFPTVCSLFGLDVDLTFFVGRDALAPGDGLVYWPDESWYDGKTYVDGLEGPHDEDQSQITELVRQKLRVCWNMILSDYFAEK